MEPQNHLLAKDPVSIQVLRIKYFKNFSLFPANLKGLIFVEKKKNNHYLPIGKKSFALLLQNTKR